MMTRKHFKMVAATVAKIENTAERAAMAEHHAEIFAADNPRFNKERFLTACEVAVDQIDAGPVPDFGGSVTAYLTRDEKRF